MPHRKSGWKNLGENYFSFSQSQRRAIFLILVLAIIGFAYNHIQVSGLKKQGHSQPFVQSEIAGLLARRDSFVNYTYGRENRDNNFTEYNRNSLPTSFATTARLFFFDPNTASLDDLLALGLREKTAKNLINYRQKGGRFRKPEDLTKLYALGTEDAKRLMPYVRIAEAPANEMANQNFETNESSVPTPFPKKERMEIGPIDVNLADSVLWQMVPGIGAKRAASIIRYRERLGGFLSLEQIRETPGLPDSIFEKMEPKLQIGGGSIQQISLNTATETQLKNHPYIGWQWAKLIVNYRNQHGDYISVDDLLKIHVVKKEWLDKVRPYLKVED